MEQPEEGYIHIKNAEANNLKGIDVDIPRNRLTVITGVSGSGKTSLAFDTLFAEGQRRFAESLSSFARQFLGRMSKPPVESISGIPPAIAIHSPRHCHRAEGQYPQPPLHRRQHHRDLRLPAGAICQDRPYLFPRHRRGSALRHSGFRHGTAALARCLPAGRRPLRDSPACTFCPQGTMPGGWRRSTRSWPT